MPSSIHFTVLLPFRPSLECHSVDILLESVPFLALNKGSGYFAVDGNLPSETILP